MSDFTFDQEHRELNFIGNPRPRNRYIPGYLFKVHTDKDYKNLERTIVRCLVETNNRRNVEKVEDYDEDYLVQQLQYID